MHPAAAHAIDVAVAGTCLWQSADIAPRTLGFLLALHDLGKYSRPFQAKSPENWPAALGPWTNIQGASHGEVGLHLLTEPRIAGLLDPLLPNWGRSRQNKQRVFQALAGHHGRPVTPPAITVDAVCPVCLDAAVAHVEAMLALFAPEPLPRPADLAAFSWRLAGLTMLADWVGSSQRWFPYVAPSALDDLAAYRDCAAAQAVRAVAAMGLVPAATAPRRAFAALFPNLDGAPTPVQAWAAAAVLPDGPALIFVEDQTGAGKTEAALLLAHRLMAAGRARGLYLALPTMATANAMYARMAEAYRRLFADGAQPSLALAHGRAGLHRGFGATVLADAAEDESVGREAEDQTAGAQCAAWLADDRRRALLAPIGVGTIDQALFAVLPVRHAPLRLLGLAGKVLVIDEAHAFDAYMTREIETLLEFHAAQGGSAVLLSATLPVATRQRFAAAYCAGLQAAAPTLAASAYPLATIVARDGATETPCPARPALRRRVTATRLPDADAAVARIVQAAAAGAAVGWVRNTVDDAIAGAAMLREAGVAPVLFHARFALGDRLAIEEQVLARFGAKPSDARAGVVVATQVIEQSLDLDFDLMVSDLAPADLLIQRAGRLWRHVWRGARPVPGPELLVVAPEPVADPLPDWIRAGVYRDPALLWRSARTLFSAGGIDAPDGLRALVEAAYDADDVPAGLCAAADRATGANRAKASVADMNVLEHSAGYAPGNGAWESDTRTPTRLEEQPQVRLRLARVEGGRVVPWCAADTPARAWALSEVSIAAQRVAECPVPAGLEAAAAAARAEWGRWEREATAQVMLAILVVVDRDEPQFATPGTVPVFAYSLSSGIVFPN